MKLVVDTNTLISGSLWQGPSALLLEAVAQRKAQLVLSPALLVEFADVLSRPKFVGRIVARRTISGDKDLLTLGSFQGIPIISAREALRRLGLEP